MDELSTFKTLVFFYIIFTLLMTLVGKVNEAGTVIEFPEITLNLNSIGDIIKSIFSLVNLVIFLLFYSLNIPILNIILWGIRLLAIMEFILYAKRVGHPTAI